MTLSPRLPSPPTAARRLEPARAAGDRSRTRRRRALLKLAERHGEVRVAVRGAAGPILHAADVLELLDELNAVERLRWGGLSKHADRTEIVYLSTARCVG